MTASLNRPVASLMAAVLLSACATAAPTPRGAPVPGSAGFVSTLDSIVGSYPFSTMQWGILVEDAATGEVLYSRNPRVKMIPASNTKLFVTLVALGRLGPGWQYRTPVVAYGRTADTAEVLVVRGSGDPTWSTRFHTTATTPLDSLAARIARSGIRHVRELQGDVSRFTDALVHPAWEVSDLNGLYAPPIDAIAAAEGTFQLVVRGTVPGAPAEAQVAGAFPQPVQATVVTDTAGARTSLTVDYTARLDTVYITGSIGAARADTSTLAVTQPARSAMLALAAALRARGVSVDDVAIRRDPMPHLPASAPADTVTVWSSPPLRDIVAAILQPSQNWIAEQVLKTLGAEYRGAGSWATGVAVEREYLLGTVGLDSASINLRDASGMSPQNLLSARAAVDMLRFARSQPWASAYREGMAQPGLQGSTLSGRLTELRGRLFAKTGTISNVATLSGYLETQGGREVLFSILVNGSGVPSSRVRAPVDSMVLAIDRAVAR